MTPGIRWSREGARLKVNVIYAPSGIVYVEGTSNNRFVNTLSALAKLEAVEKFFFIDARASDLAAVSLAVRPDPDRSRDRDVQPHQRDDPWGKPVHPRAVRRHRDDVSRPERQRLDERERFGRDYRVLRQYTVARLNSAPTTVSWDLEYNRRNTNYSGQNGFVNDIYRGRLTWNIDPQFRVFGIGGYETNNYSITNQSGPIYGGGLEWHPTERTTVAGFYEERFFGPSWSANFTHRRPLSFVSLVGFVRSRATRSWRNRPPPAIPPRSSTARSCRGFPTRPSARPRCSGLSRRSGFRRLSSRRSRSIRRACS